MRNQIPIIVLKFGSSVLRSEDDLPTAVHEIYRWWKHGYQVLAVVSAFGNTTDDLSRRAQSACNQPDDALVAALLATGETASSALLGLSLNRAGIPATVFDAEQAGLSTVGPILDSDLVSVDTTNMHRALRHGVVVLPGFVGRGPQCETTLLGRGGSDLTALFLAQRLGGVCRLIKDVDGLYTSDPNEKGGTAAARFAQVSYETARAVGGSVVQPKTIDFAKQNQLRLLVSAIGADRATEIGPFNDRVSLGESNVRPLRIALLGCGTVGGGVYQRLAALPEFFEVVGVGTRNVDRAIDEQVPVRLITTHLEALAQRDVDVVVELLGGIEPSETLIGKALRRGCHVVTANKALLASQQSKLENLADQCGGTIRYSAAVGGVVPALETVRRARKVSEVSSISGVVNGTTNFILEELSSGKEFATAIKLAQQLGYTEADPRSDLDGTDAAQKLILLAREAFDIELPFASIRRLGIDAVDVPVRGSGQKVRLVATCRRTSAGIEANVSPLQLPANHPFAEVNGVNNRVIVESTDGRTWDVSGRGAGRWPTTEAVIADLFDIRSEIAVRNELEETEECVA